MAKSKNKNYYPYNVILDSLIFETDSRLFNLWSIIGNKIICVNTPEFSTINHLSVNELFTTDPIAYRLMQRIIDYNSKAERIYIYQDHKYGCINMQSFRRISEVFKDSTNSELIVAEKSKFVVILCEGKDLNTTSLYFWDLSSCI